MIVKTMDDMINLDTAEAYAHSGIAVTFILGAQKTVLTKYAPTPTRCC
jgi:hypothetical protein